MAPKNSCKFLPESVVNPKSTMISKKKLVKINKISNFLSKKMKL